MKKIRNTLLISSLLLTSLLAVTSCDNNDNVQDTIKVESITCDSSLTLVKGESKELNYVINPTNATNQEVEFTYDDSIIKVENKRVFALNTGKTNLIIRSKEDPNIKAVIEITVNEESIQEDKLLSISTDFNRSILGINEEIQINLFFNPSDTSLTRVKYRSSDPSVVSVSNKGIVKGVASGEALITIQSLDNLELDPLNISLKVSNKADEVNNDKAYSLLRSAAFKESNEVVSGNISIKNKTRNSDEATFTNTYKSYIDATYNSLKTYDNKSYDEYHGIYEDRYYEYINENNEKRANSYEILDSDKASFTSQITRKDAIKATSLPGIYLQTYSNKFIYGVGAFIEEELDSTFKELSNITLTESSLTLKKIKEDYTYKTIYLLDVKFSSNGNYESVTYYEKEYLGTDLDSNFEVINNASPVSYYVFEANLTSGNKVKEENPEINPRDFYYNDFEVEFFKSTDLDRQNPSLTFNRMDTIVFYPKTCSPSTALTSIDRIEIKEVSDKNVLNVSPNLTAMIASEGGTSTVTLKSKYVTKTYTITVNVLEPTSLKFSTTMPSAIKANDSFLFSVEPEPFGAKDDIVVSLKDGDEKYATILDKNEYGFYTFKGNPSMEEKQATVTIIAESASNKNIRAEKQVKIIKEMSDLEILDLLVSSPFISEPDKYYYDRYVKAEFFKEVVDNKRSGKFYIMKGEEILNEATFNYAITNGKITVYSVAFTSDWASALSLTISSPDISELRATFEDSRESEEDGTTLSYKLYRKDL